MNDYLSSAKKQFSYYKMLGDKTFEQLVEEQLFMQLNECNSIGTIVKHLHGNMLSRWTDFMSSDGEKEWRMREAEFENDIESRTEMMSKWEEGWQCLFNALNSLRTEDLNKEIYIRNMGHSVTEAINRQLSHYSYHIGQIVLTGKMICGNEWTSLSIPKGKSKEYNAEKFAKDKRREHFTDDL